MAESSSNVMVNQHRLVTIHKTPNGASCLIEPLSEISKPIEGMKSGYEGLCDKDKPTLFTIWVVKKEGGERRYIEEEINPYSQDAEQVRVQMHFCPKWFAEIRTRKEAKQEVTAALNEDRHGEKFIGLMFCPSYEPKP